jgi:hypothetical protein
MNSDVAGFHEHLRASTIQLLGYADANQLTAAQQIRLDRAIMLRLTIDDAQARQMRGEAIDVHAFVSASEDLERMVGGNPEALPPARFGVDHKARLKELIERTVLAASVDDPGEAERTAELMKREEMAAVIAAGGIEPAPAPSPPAPIMPDNVVQLSDAAERANSALPPKGYLKDEQPREPWEQYYNGRAVGPPPWPLPQREEEWVSNNNNPELQR